VTLRREDRAVSTAITHAMAVGITTLLITGLLVGSSQMIEDRRQLVTERGLEDIGSSLTSEIVRMDQFNTTNTNVSITSTNPEHIAGSGYDVEILDRSSGSPPPYSYVMYLNSSAGSLTVEVPVRFQTDTEVCAGHADGGTVVIEYDGDPATTDCLRISNP